MTVGILGLGLIGGSLARADCKADHTVYVCDKDQNMLEFAKLSGVVTDSLNENTLNQCQLILLAVYPEGCIQWLEDNAHLINADTLVIDCCGVKENICRRGFELAQLHGFTFVGGHPMAGSQYSGFKHSRASLFKGASMIIVPPVYDDMELRENVKRLFAPLEFKSFVVTTAEHHDRMIAYTSQMCHIAANAYIKSSAARDHQGYSAGSFSDLTRVARLNEAMWTELFLDNKKPLLDELDKYITSLQQYREALANEDADRLCALLREGRVAKELSEG